MTFSLPKHTNANTHEEEKLTFFSEKCDMHKVRSKQPMLCTSSQVDCLCATLPKQNIFHIISNCSSMHYSLMTSMLSFQKVNLI